MKQKDEWLCGYAAGLAAATKAFRDRSRAYDALASDGLTLRDLRKGGAEPDDIDWLTAETTESEGT